MIIAPVPAQDGRLETVLHPADVQRAVLSPGVPLVPPLETPLRLALVVQAVPPSPHVQPPIPAQGLHADVLPAVLPVARGALALARRLLAVVQPTPLDPRARVPRVAARRAALPGAEPVALAAAARVAPVAPAGDLGRARLRLARVRLAEEGPIADQPWPFAPVVRRREAAVLRAIPLAAFMLAVFAVRVFAAVWCSDAAVSQTSLPAAQTVTTASVGDGLTVVAVLEPLRVPILDALHAAESIRAHGLAPKI